MDLHVLERLRAIQRPGAPDIVARSVRTYLRSSRELMVSLRQAVGQHATAAAVAAVHTLGASSALVGAARFSALCREMEAKGETLDRSAAEEGLRALEREYRRMTEFLTGYFGEEQP